MKIRGKDRVTMKDRAQKSRGSNIAITLLGFGFGFLVLAYALGVFVGGFLDERFDTGPLFLIIGVGVALAFSALELVRALKRIEKREKEQKQHQDLKTAAQIDQDEADFFATQDDAWKKDEWEKDEWQAAWKDEPQEDESGPKQ